MGHCRSKRIIDCDPGPVTVCQIENSCFTVFRNGQNFQISTILWLIFFNLKPKLKYILRLN